MLNHLYVICNNLSSAKRIPCDSFPLTDRCGLYIIYRIAHVLTPPVFHHSFRYSILYRTVYHRQNVSVEMMLCFLMPALMIVIDYCICFKPKVIMKFWEYDSFRSFSYVTCIYLILLFGVFEKVDFIYFQF